MCRRHLAVLLDNMALLQQNSHMCALVPFSFVLSMFKEKTSYFLPNP